MSSSCAHELIRPCSMSCGMRKVKGVIFDIEFYVGQTIEERYASIRTLFACKYNSVSFFKYQASHSQESIRQLNICECIRHNRTIRVRTPKSVFFTELIERINGCECSLAFVRRIQKTLTIEYNTQYIYE